MKLLSLISYIFVYLEFAHVPAPASGPHPDYSRLLRRRARPLYCAPSTLFLLSLLSYIHCKNTKLVTKFVTSHSFVTKLRSSLRATMNVGNSSICRKIEYIFWLRSSLRACSLVTKEWFVTKFVTSFVFLQCATAPAPQLQTGARS